MTRSELGIVCPYCHADPDQPCEERERGPLTLTCLIQAELDLETGIQVRDQVDHTRTDKPRLSHAVPEGSNVALCGIVPTGNPSKGDSRRCPECERAARMGWIAR
jgi:hypothetical protein